MSWYPYAIYDMQRDMTSPLRAAAGGMLAAMDTLPHEWVDNPLFRHIAAMQQMAIGCTITHERPSFGIDTTTLRGVGVPVVEHVVHETPFAELIHFRKQPAEFGPEPDLPRVLVVAPMSGQFATLLTETVRTLLPDNDVYITDWRNARDIPTSAGRFGMDEYIDHVVDFIRELGPHAHVLAVSQPCVQALAAVALLAASNDPAQPDSLTLMAGPVDTRINANDVDRFATSMSLEQLRTAMITTVPYGYPGRGREVYPGFVQLGGFLSMNTGRLFEAYCDLYTSLMAGAKATSHSARRVYDQYCAVEDLPAEFYLETVSHVFQEHRLARGELTWRGRPIDPSQIRQTALLTVEGERDDLCSLGQTQAAHALCSEIPVARKKHHVQAGVDHYGVFSGQRWHHEIYPVVHHFITAASPAPTTIPTPVQA